MNMDIYWRRYLLERNAEFARREAEKLEEEKNRLARATLHNEGVLILRLPVEIFHHIFEIARGQTRFDDSAKDGPWRSIKERPEVAISHVCRSWRSISLAQPELWSHFLHVHRDRPNPFKWMTAYLDRSNSCPLDILLDLFRTDGTSHSKVILDSLIPHASRWRRLSIYMDGSNWGPYIDDIPIQFGRFSAPILEVLEIIKVHPDISPEQEVPPVFLRSAPNLVSVGIEMKHCLSLISVCQTMTTLHLQGEKHSSMSKKPWGTLLLVLAIPTLVNLTIEGDCFKWPLAGESRPSQRTVAANLRKLRIYTGFTVVNHMQYFVVAPELELLALYHSTITMDATFTDMLQHIPSNNFPSLKTLALIDCEADSPTLLNLSNLTNGITHLILGTQAAIARTCVAGIIAIGQQAALWPNIELVTYTLTFRLFPGAAKMLDNPGPAECANLVNWRLEVFNRRCVLRVGKSLVDWWTHHSKGYKNVWNRYRDTHLMELVDTESENSNVQHASVVPWPHRRSGHFNVNSEYSFATF